MGPDSAGAPATDAVATPAAHLHGGAEAEEAHGRACRRIRAAGLAADQYATRARTASSGLARESTALAETHRKLTASYEKLAHTLTPDATDGAGREAFEVEFEQAVDDLQMLKVRLRAARDVLRSTTAKRDTLMMQCGLHDSALIDRAGPAHGADGGPAGAASLSKRQMQALAKARLAATLSDGARLDMMKRLVPSAKKLAAKPGLSTAQRGMFTAQLGDQMPPTLPPKEAAGAVASRAVFSAQSARRLAGGEAEAHRRKEALARTKAFLEAKKGPPTTTPKKKVAGPPTALRPASAAPGVAARRAAGEGSAVGLGAPLGSRSSQRPGGATSALIGSASGPQLLPQGANPTPACAKPPRKPLATKSAVAKLPAKSAAKPALEGNRRPVAGPPANPAGEMFELTVPEGCAADATLHIRFTLVLATETGTVPQQVRRGRPLAGGPARWAHSTGDDTQWAAAGRRVRSPHAGLRERVLQLKAKAK